MPRDPPLCVTVVVHQEDLLASLGLAVRDERNRGHCDAPAASEVEDDLVGHRMGETAREIDSPVEALAQNELPAGQVVGPSLKDQLLAAELELGEQRNFVAVGAVLLEILGSVAGEGNRRQDFRALYIEELREREVLAEGLFHLAHRVQELRSGAGRTSGTRHGEIQARGRIAVEDHFDIGRQLLGDRRRIRILLRAQKQRPAEQGRYCDPGDPNRRSRCIEALHDHHFLIVTPRLDFRKLRGSGLI